MGQFQTMRCVRSFPIVCYNATTQIYYILLYSLLPVYIWVHVVNSVSLLLRRKGDWNTLSERCDWNNFCYELCAPYWFLSFSWSIIIDGTREWNVMTIQRTCDQYHRFGHVSGKRKSHKTTPTVSHIQALFGGHHHAYGAWLILAVSWNISFQYKSLPCKFKASLGFSAELQQAILYY